MLGGADSDVTCDRNYAVKNRKKVTTVLARIVFCTFCAITTVNVY